MSSSSIPRTDDGDAKLNNILPSYQMFQSTISQTLTSSQEDFTSQPPMYEMTPVSSATTSVVQSAVQSPIYAGSAVESREAFPFPTMGPESHEDGVAQIWEDTILANFHRLTNLDRRDNQYAKNLAVDIKFTADVCQKGVVPEIIDPAKLELKQDDYIHGYVIIENTSAEPINFQMLYVMLEGTIVVLENDDGLIDTQKPKSVHQFLTMPDLYASWTYANIDRLTTDHGYPHDWCEGDIDPVDGTHLSLDLQKQFLPHIRYKRFFSFKLPKKLLEDICDVHNLAAHCQLPSTLGYPKYHVKPSVLYINKDQQVNDLMFLDTSVSYCVTTRVIGRASQYNAGDNQFVIAKESAVPVRVVPSNDPSLRTDPVAVERYFHAFNKAIDEKIETGNLLLNAATSLSELSLTPMSAQDSKVRQLYVSSNHDRESKRPIPSDSGLQVYKNTIPLRKRGLISTKLMSGMVSLTTPKTEYLLPYVPPPKLRKGPAPNLLFQIPLELEMYDSSKAALDVKNIKAELCCVTIRSPKYLIPVELNHEVYLPDHAVEHELHKLESDLVRNAITRPAKRRFEKLNDLILQHGEAFLVEKRQYHDLKGLANLAVKVGEFPIANIVTYPERSTQPTHASDIRWDQNKKNIVLEIDLGKATAGQNKSSFFDQITLVPPFQSCFVVRLYHLKVTVKLTNADVLVVRVPIKFENM